VTDNFLDKVVKWYQLKSDGDELYAKFMTLQLFGNILSKQSFVNIVPQCKRFNLYLALVGDSYYARKNVTQDMFKRLYPSCKILPNESSAEKFLQNLSKQPSGIWMCGEISKILKHINKGGYLSSIVETLNDLHNYDYPEYVRDTLGYTVKIRYPYPFFNTTITPTVLQKEVDPEMLEGGFFSKVILVPGKPGKGGRTEIPKEAFKLEAEIKDLLLPLFNEVVSLEFKLTPEAMELFNEMELDARKSKVKSIAGRYTEDIVILAGLICFGRALEAYSLNSKKSKKSKKSNTHKSKESNNFMLFIYKTHFTIITAEDIKKAHKMIQPCIKLAEELYDYSSMNRKYIVRFRAYVEQHYPIPRSLVLRNCNMDDGEGGIAERTLKQHELLQSFTYQGIRADGVMKKKQIIYCITNPDKDKCKECGYREECGIDD